MYKQYIYVQPAQPGQATSNQLGSQTMPPRLSPRLHRIVRLRLKWVSISCRGARRRREEEEEEEEEEVYYERKKRCLIKDLEVRGK